MGWAVVGWNMERIGWGRMEWVEWPEKKNGDGDRKDAKGDRRVGWYGRQEGWDEMG